MDAISTIIDTLSVGRDSKNDGGRKVKAILVIDNPKSCEKCYYRFIGNDNSSYCGLTKTFMNRKTDVTKEIDVCCPLRPMPKKKEVEVNEIEDIMHTEYSIEDIYTNKYVATIRLATDKLISLGWNACLDEILGENNG